MDLLQAQLDIGIDNSDSSSSFLLLVEFRNSPEVITRKENNDSKIDFPQNNCLIYFIIAKGGSSFLTKEKVKFVVTTTINNIFDHLMKDIPIYAYIGLFP